MLSRTHLVSKYVLRAASPMCLHRLSPFRPLSPLRPLSSVSREKQQRDRSGAIVLQLKEATRKLETGRYLLRSTRLAIHDGEHIAVLGVNGAGKSTLLRVLAGKEKLEEGEVWRDPHLRIGCLDQEPVLDEGKTVIQNVLAGVSEQLGWIERFEKISVDMCDPKADFDALLSEQGDLQEKIDQHNVWDLEERALSVMRALGCPAPDSSCNNLSGGERRRVALSQLLTEQPQMLLLDEPTNHLDAASTAWLQRYLNDYKGTVILITHDRYFMESVTQWILEVDRGDVTPFMGAYCQWLAWKGEQIKAEKAHEKLQVKLMKKELEWARQSPTARKNQNKARLKRLETGTVSEKTRFETGQLIIPSGPRLGDLVIRVDNLTKHFDGNCLFDNLSFKLEKGWTVGVVGANGAGKSTLMRVLLGDEKPDKGNIIFGSTVCLGHLSQSRHNMDVEQSVYSEISGGNEYIQVGDRTMNARNYVAQFNFRGVAQEKKIGMLSGGERNRVHLAKALRKGYNVLLLDEPTNDLDVDTLRALEEALPEFDGCSLVVSHDRWFLNRVCTHILAFEGDGCVNFFSGNYEEYEAHKRMRQATPVALVA